MTNTDLATAAVGVSAIETQARARLQMDDADGGERDAATAVVRQAGALRRVLEQWIVRRATRAPREHAQATGIAETPRGGFDGR